MRVIFYLQAILAISFGLLMGCTGHTAQQGPSLPDLETGNIAQATGGTQLLGLYEITIDPETSTAAIIPNRSALVELNVLKFLEPPDSMSALIVDNVVVNPPKLKFELGIMHPFAGAPEFSIFSTRGVFLSNGSMGGFDNPLLILSSPSELRLTNADGLTRWMNPVEFPYDGTILNYYPGKHGDPNGDNYTSTLNPYKLYANGLSVMPDNMDLDESMKSMFKAGSLVWRHYEMDFGNQGLLTFQYAILASWEPPINYPPLGPDDYPPGTVATEPWRVDVTELINTLVYDTGQQEGELMLRVEVRDFENAAQDMVYIEAPGIFPHQEMPLVNQDGQHLTFELNVADIVLSSADPFDVLIAAVAQDGVGYDGRLPGEELATYKLHTVEVDDNIPDPPGWPFYDDFENYDYVWTTYGGNWWGEYNSSMDSGNGGSCYEEEKDPPEDEDENPNVSYVTSPPIEVPASPKDLIIVFNHTLKVDPAEEWAHFVWDMCYIRINGEQVDPAKIVGGPPYEHGHIPWTFDDMFCWSGYYAYSETTFNLGAEYNGTTITIDFVLDTWDYMNNCYPYTGWQISDILVDFAD